MRKDGKWALSLSSAAQHLYDAVGKDWQKHVARRRDARRRDRAMEVTHAAAAATRDAAWPYVPPNLEGLSFLHAHTIHGDRWIAGPGKGP
jgi:hypothetical protein